MVYQNDWNGLEVDYIHKYGEETNTSRNERVTLQVYDTCLQMCDFFELRRKDSLVPRFLLTRGRPELFPLQRHPVV